MSSETSPSGPLKAPVGGIAGFFKNLWYSLLIQLNALFWNTYELFTPHRKFDIEKAGKRPGENIVITGGARGIGREIIKKLLTLEMNVIMGVRSEAAAKTMVEELRKDVTTGTVDVMQLDLKSLASVKEFANKVIAKYSKIHVLINNAGIYSLPYEITEDGFEITFQVNYLSHFLLTNMLLPRLTAACTAGKAARVVHVSSVAHYPGKLNLNDLWMEKIYGTNWAYGNSKLMQVVLSNYMNDQCVKDGCPVRSYSVHPGVIASGLYNEFPKIMQGIMWLMFKTNEQGADGVLYVALSPKVENDGGKYFQNSAIFGVNSQANNTEVQGKLWEASCKATGWEDTFTSHKPRSLKKQTPSIVVTKENNSNESQNKVTKDDLENEGDNN